MSDIPEWALRESCKRFGENYTDYTLGRLSVFVGHAIRVCASLIAEYENEPVDPLLVEAREIAAKAAFDKDCLVHEESIRSGQRDDHPDVQIALAALKRGMELARETQP